MSHPLTEHIEEKIFSVEEYLTLVNELLGPLKVFVEGEISDLKVLPQWVFFSLKDVESGTVLRCGLHAGAYRRLGVNVEDGMTVKVFGYGKLSPKTGNFGFWVSKIEPVGEGALRVAYELLLKKLTKEGLFERKRELPEFINHIGVISSRNGVVVQDLMQNLKPLGIRVDFMHSGVEGADSAKEILGAVEYFNNAKEKPQVLVLIRGGGSFESLQGFNNEAVVRAIYASPVPVLVGIGHDVDAPIATMVSDWSASTPTAVAHVINESWSPLAEKVPEYLSTITTEFIKKIHNIEHKADLHMQTIRHAISRIFMAFNEYESALKDATKRISLYFANTHETTDRHIQNIRNILNLRIISIKQTIVNYERILTMSDPKKILKRGFSLVYNNDGKLVRSIKEVEMGDFLKISLNDGVLESQVIKK